MGRFNTLVTIPLSIDLAQNAIAFFSLNVFMLYMFYMRTFLSFVSIIQNSPIDGLMSKNTQAMNFPCYFV